MDNHLLRYIGSYTRSIQSLCDIRYKHLNLQKGQFLFLMRICEHPNISQQELSNLISVEKSTTTRALQKLENDGYILRNRNKDDQRKFSVIATKKGLDLYPELARYELHLSKKLQTQVTKKELDVLTSLFERLMDDLPTSDTPILTNDQLKIQLADTDALLSHCHLIRKEVFQIGQGVDKAIELDGRDDESQSLIGYFNGQPAGTVRLRPIDAGTMKLERLAVLKEYRGMSIASSLIEYCTVLARHQNFKRIKLHAQVTALPIYTRAGYDIIGDEFLEADIVHVLASKDL